MIDGDQTACLASVAGAGGVRVERQRRLDLPAKDATNEGGETECASDATSRKQRRAGMRRGGGRGAGGSEPRQG